MTSDHIIVTYGTNRHAAGCAFRVLRKCCESNAAHAHSLRMERDATKVQTLPSIVSPPLPAKGMEQAFGCLYFLTKQCIAHTTNYEPLLILMNYLGVHIKVKA